MYNKTMANRGMKKWLPFQSLIEQEKYLDKMMYEKYKVEKPQISVEQARKINRILCSYNFEVLKMKIYMDGYLYIYNGKIQKIDKNKKILIFDDFYVPIKNVIDIEETDPFFEVC